MKLSEKIKGQPFPTDGKVRAAQCADYLAISISGFWLYVKQGRIKRPLKIIGHPSTYTAG